MIATTLNTPVTASKPPSVRGAGVAQKAAETTLNVRYSSTLAPTKGGNASVAQAPKKSFQKKMEALWKRWHKAITIAGSATAIGVTGLGLAHFMTRHNDINSWITKNDTAREVGEFRKELDRVESMVRNSINLEKKDVGKDSINATKNKGSKDYDIAKDKFDVANLMQEVFDISSLKQSASVTPAEAEVLKVRTVTVGLQYAMLHDRDQIPSLIKQIYNNRGLNPAILETLDLHQRDQVGIPEASQYLKKARKPSTNFKADNIRGYKHFDIGDEDYKQTHMALSYLVKYGAPKEARELLLEKGNMLYDRSETNYKNPESHAEVVALLDLYAVYCRKYDTECYLALQDLAKKIIHDDAPAKIAFGENRELLNKLENRLGITNTEPLETKDHSSPAYRSERLRDILRLRIQITEPTPNNQLATDGNAPYLALNHYMNDVAEKLTPNSNSGAEVLNLNSKEVQTALQAIKVRYDLAAELHEAKHFLNTPQDTNTHLNSIHAFSQAIKPHLPHALTSKPSFMHSFNQYVARDRDALIATLASIPVEGYDANTTNTVYHRELDVHTERFHTFLEKYWMPILNQIVKHSVQEHNTPYTTLPDVHS